MPSPTWPTSTAVIEEFALARIVLEELSPPKSKTYESKVEAAVLRD